MPLQGISCCRSPEIQWKGIKAVPNQRLCSPATQKVKAPSLLRLQDPHSSEYEVSSSTAMTVCHNHIQVGVGKHTILTKQLRSTWEKPMVSVCGKRSFYLTEIKSYRLGRWNLNCLVKTQLRLLLACSCFDIIHQWDVETLELAKPIRLCTHEYFIQ